MKKKVTVQFPLNLQEDDKYLYESNLTFEYGKLRVKHFRNVFVTFSGFCMNRGGLIKDTHHNYPNQYNDYLNEASMYYYDVLDNPDNLITLDDENIYLVIHHPWFNYYHWVCESIFRLWQVRRKINKLTLILPEYYKNADFITGSLMPFGIKNIYYIPNGKSLLVRNVLIPQIKPICDSYNPVYLRQVRKFYRDFALNNRKDRIGYERLYITRRMAPRRQIVNEIELIDIAIKYGFAIFSPEQYKFLDQVSIFADVKFLIGAHGSALTNILFMNDNSSMLELHKNKTNELTYPSPLFWYMAHPLKINYFHQSCDTPGQEDYFEGEYFVNPELFEQNLLKMLASTSRILNTYQGLINDKK